MEVLKKVCKAGSVVCLVGAMLSSSVGFTVVSVAMAAIAFGIEIKNWRKYQSVETTEKYQEQNRIRQQRYREKLKSEKEKSNVTITENNEVEDNTQEKNTRKENDNNNGFREYKI